MRYLLALFFVGFSLFGDSSETTHSLQKKIAENWNAHEVILKEFFATNPNETGLRGDLLQQAYDRCHEAVQASERLLKLTDVGVGTWLFFHPDYDSLRNLHKKTIKEKKFLEDQRHQIEIWINLLSAPQTYTEAVALELELFRSLADPNDSAPSFSLVIARYEEASRKADMAALTDLKADCQRKASKLWAEEVNWGRYVKNQRRIVQETLFQLAKDAEYFDSLGFKKCAYSLRKQALSTLKKLLPFIKEQRNLLELETSLTSTLRSFEQKITPKSPPQSSMTDFQEEQKRKTFRFFQNQQTRQFYTDQYYRFFIEDGEPITHFFVKVLKNGEVLHQEKILLPLMKTSLWKEYLLSEGRLYIPETSLKKEFGIDLLCQLIYSPFAAYTLAISHKGSIPGYTVVFSLKKDAPLTCTTFFEAPPWQLSCLLKPHRLETQVIKEQQLHTVAIEKEIELLAEPKSYPQLNQLVEELQGDPLLLAQYVQNEIAFVDPLLYTSSILRNPLVTFLEKKGSPYEQCQLLVYLLRKAGFKAQYAIRENSLTETYPWVAFFDGGEWISLFPWLKELKVDEGYDVYHLLPDAYRTPERWIQQYLGNDPEILKHAQGDDTAGLLFLRFVEEELKKQHLTLSDVGLHQTIVKNNFTKWEDFPRIKLESSYRFIDTLDEIPSLFATVNFEISSRENPDKKIAFTERIANFPLSGALLQFKQNQNGQYLLIQSPEIELNHQLHLDQSDQSLELKVTSSTMERHFFLPKETFAIFSFHFGGTEPAKSIQFRQDYATETDPEKRTKTLLAYVAATYFEKSSRSREHLADLYKVHSRLLWAMGITKIDQGRPQLDMLWVAPTVAANRETNFAEQQFNLLATVDASSHEHQVIREIFNDPSAVSSVKLLQLAHQNQSNFLSFESSSFALADASPGAAALLLFPESENTDLIKLERVAEKQWGALKDAFQSKDPLSDWTTAYIAPSTNENGVGTLILSPTQGRSLLSNNGLLINGGAGSFTTEAYDYPNWIYTYPPATDEMGFTPPGIFFGQHPCNLNQINSSPYSTNFFDNQPLYTESFSISPMESDVRLDHKTESGWVGDPIDIVTGAFFLDELDLLFPGTFPLEIRRNYSSKNPLLGDLGHGWKLSLNPYLYETEDDLFVTELDGTFIAYTYDAKQDCWIVKRENNPYLQNFSHNAIGGKCNPFHTYIKDDILYAPDGSKRFFADGKLTEWVDSEGNTLTFSYKNDLLTRIENSKGDFCGFHHNFEGMVTEIYAKDGQRISYAYNSQKDLVEVTLPNGALIRYEYDDQHRVIREVRPHGKVVENRYDEYGRVTEQYTPDGIAQELTLTAKLLYREGETAVLDGLGGTTTYKIYNNQIYKITDPVGVSSYYCWFIDDTSWFDPHLETVITDPDLKGKFGSLKYITDKRGLTTFYTYDTKGNPIETSLEGDDLTADGWKKIVKSRVYNEKNLCIEERVDSKTTITTYDENFPYLPKRIETFVQDTMTNYLEFSYDEKGRVLKEDYSGAITLFEYGSSDLPLRKIEQTQTDDPDLITTFSYNYKGQCTEVYSSDAIEENIYDLMGNLLSSTIYDPYNNLVKAKYAGYDLNNQLIWEKGLDPNKITYFDRHPSGKLNALRRFFSSDEVQYTLYDYDPLGNAIQEVDPKGSVTSREYDPIGRMIRETKEGHTTYYTYEAGGLIESVTSPSGATTTRSYTTNGLLKEECYPDGTKKQLIYDTLGRPILETKNGITIETHYDDKHHRVLKVHVGTGTQEIEEFDPRGNLIRSIDAAGYVTTRTYDGLNRIKTLTNPKQETTFWSYTEDTTSCTFPNGEVETVRKVAGQVVERTRTDSEGLLLSHLLIDFDNSDDTIDHLLPEKSDPQHHYDGLSRLVKKELADGSVVEYIYDLDSNLIGCHLPNGNTWVASYDTMHRK
ncbi:MAG: DUF6531 domain-containing protein, partial [Chlamydiia bacterium]